MFTHTDDLSISAIWAVGCVGGLFFDFCTDKTLQSLLKDNEEFVFDYDKAERSLRAMLSSADRSERDFVEGCRESAGWCLGGTVELYRDVANEAIVSVLNEASKLDRQSDIGKLVEVICDIVTSNIKLEDGLRRIDTDNSLDYVKTLGKLMLIREFLLENKYPSKLLQPFNHEREYLLDAVGLNILTVESVRELVAKAEEAYLNNVKGLDIEGMGKEFEHVLNSKGYDNRIGLRVLVTNAIRIFDVISEVALFENIASTGFATNMLKYVKVMPYLMSVISIYNQWIRGYIDKKLSKGVEWLEHLFLFIGGDLHMGNAVNVNGCCSLLYFVCNEVKNMNANLGRVNSIH